VGCLVEANISEKYGVCIFSTESGALERWRMRDRTLLRNVGFYQPVHSDLTQKNINMKMTVFWVISQYSLVKVSRSIRGACCLHHQGDHLDNGGLTAHEDSHQRFQVTSLSRVVLLKSIHPSTRMEQLQKWPKCFPTNFMLVSSTEICQHVLTFDQIGLQQQQQRALYMQIFVFSIL
jgi:hypothetical protein